MDLTILIPTFDRPSEVNQRLEEISNEFGSGIPVVIQVNPGQYTAEDISRQSQLRKLVIRENQSNIGFVANIVSGMLSIHTEWVWILGDDDPIRSGSKEEISTSIRICDQELAQMTVFNQWHRSQNEQGMVCRDVDDFVKATGFADCLFISALVWRSSFLSENLGILIDYSFTRASQAMIQLCNLSVGQSAIYVRNQKLINYTGLHRWSRLDYLQRLDKIFYDPRLSNYKSQVFGFLLPQASWALSSSIAEVNSWGVLITWIWLAARYNAKVFATLGPREGLLFSLFLQRAMLGHVAKHAKRHLRINHRK